MFIFFFFFNDPSTTEIYTLSLHDALPICSAAHAPRSPVIHSCGGRLRWHDAGPPRARPTGAGSFAASSEEHTSELQSQSILVCRLLLVKKKNIRSQTVKTSIRNHC